MHTSPRLGPAPWRWLAVHWLVLRPHFFWASASAALAGLALADGVPLARGALAFAGVLVARGLLAPLASPRLERLVWGGPVGTAAGVAFLPVLARLAAAGPARDALADPRLWLVAGSVFGSAATLAILGSLQQLATDRRRRRETIPVLYGRHAAVLVSAGFLALGLGESALLVTSVAGAARLALPGLVLWATGVGAAVLSHKLAWAARHDERARPALLWAVRGFLALHLGEAAILRPPLAAGAILLLAAFELVLRARRP